MKKTLHFIMPLLFILSFQALGQRAKSFKPEQFKHTNVGCPMNSNCSRSVGAAYAKWVKTLRRTNKSKNQVRLLNNLATKIGLPFTHWVANKGSFSEELIVWDSHCRNHNIEGQSKIHIGLQFINNTSQAVKLEKEALAYNRYMLILDQVGRITRRIVPRSDTPLYFNGDELIYQIQLEGQYFSQSLDKRGDLRVVKSITPKEFPRTIDCPKKLLAHANLKKDQDTKNLYLGFFCQKTWDKQTGKLNTILLPWSCN